MDTMNWTLSPAQILNMETSVSHVLLRNKNQHTRVCLFYKIVDLLFVLLFLLLVFLLLFVITTGRRIGVLDGCKYGLIVTVL